MDIELCVLMWVRMAEIGGETLLYGNRLSYSCRVELLTLMIRVILVYQSDHCSLTLIMTSIIQNPKRFGYGDEEMGDINIQISTR